MLTGQTLADRWMNPVMTRVIIFGKWYGATWPSRGVPRGPVEGCHVAPLQWLASGKNFGTPQESNPQPPGGGSALAGPEKPACPWYFLNHMV